MPSIALPTVMEERSSMRRDRDLKAKIKHVHEVERSIAFLLYEHWLYFVPNAW